MKTKELTTHAATAKAIRKELKECFPNASFSVKSDSFAGGNSVSISWVNGPTSDSVRLIADKYQYGHFNGMEDIYEHTNSRQDIPQVKYVTWSRVIQDEIHELAFGFFKARLKGWESLADSRASSSELMKEWGVCTPREYSSRKLWKMDLTHCDNEPKLYRMLEAALNVL